MLGKQDKSFNSISLYTGGMLQWYFIETLDILNTDEAIYACPNYIKIESGRPVTHSCNEFALHTSSVAESTQIMNNFFSIYEPIQFEKIEKKDLVVFKDAQGVTRHLALVFEKGSTVNETTIIGKFANLELIQHQLKYTPNFYGVKVSFFRKKNPDAYEYLMTLICKT